MFIFSPIDYLFVDQHCHDNINHGCFFVYLFLIRFSVNFTQKKAVSSGLPSKKLKKVSSLVQKWQQVKQKVDEEMMEDSSEDEDPTVVSQKRIEEWKKAQLERLDIL